MAGRYNLIATPEEVAAHFDCGETPWFPPRYNIAPSQPIAVVRRVLGTRRFDLVRWGLIPGWAKDPRRFGSLINARAEGIAEKAAFRGAVQYRRCLVPASGYYHWQRGPAGSAPWLVRPRDRGPIAFAGLWETWLGADGSEIDTACIVTTGANATLAPIADRMPAILMPGSYERWLDSDRHSAGSALALLRPAPDTLIETVPVSTRVNRAENDDPGLIEPLAQTDGPDA